MKEEKPIHVKPIFYAYCFERLKTIAKDCGYNLTLHGSMNRDLDLIAIPWQEEVRPHGEMIQLFVDEIGGEIMQQQWVNGHLHESNSGEFFTVTHHGRMWYVINLKRNYTDAHGKYEEDKQYYLDIAVLPTRPKDESPQPDREGLEELAYSKAYEILGGAAGVTPVAKFVQAFLAGYKAAKGNTEGEVD